MGREGLMDATGYSWPPPLLEVPSSSKPPGLDSIRKKADGNFLPPSLTLGVR